MMRLWWIFVLLGMAFGNKDFWKEAMDQFLEERYLDRLDRQLRFANI